MTKKLLWVGILLVVLVAAGGLWIAFENYQTRIASLELEVQSMDASLRASESEAARSAAEAVQQKVAAEAAQEQAAQLQSAAEQEQQLRSKAEAARENAEQAKIEAEDAATTAQQQAKLADEAANRARDQLEAVIAARQAELDRMQQALSRIVETERTESGMVVVLKDSHFKFGFDRATLTPENRELLSRIAGVLLASSGYRLSIDGYTDDIGPSEYNQQLSERRARNVADYLIQAGLPPEVVEVHGFGESNPKRPGTSSEARAENRRVEIGITDTVITYHGIASNHGPATP